MQLLAKLSESLSILDEFRALEQEGERVCLIMCKATEMLAAVVVVVLALYLFGGSANSA